MQRDPNEKPTIDLTRTEFERHLGEFTLFGTWVFNEDQDDTEPALVILPTHRDWSNIRPAVVCLSVLYQYRDLRYAGLRALQFIQGFGMKPSASLMNRIVNLIHDSFVDIVKMPPEPVDEIVIGQTTYRINGGAARTADALDFVPRKQI